jgi:hypothetical protein
MKIELINHDEKIWRSGLCFRVRYIDDDTNDPPWENDCGTGIVSDWTMRDKKPGEIVLSDPDGRHRSRRYYDWAGTMDKAKAEGWGLSDEEKGRLAARLGRIPTVGEVRQQAVRLDFDRLKAWCDDQWRYVGVVVQQLEDEDDDPKDDFEHALWGIDSDQYKYLTEVAEDLIGEIVHEVHLAAVAQQKEDDERLYWESRGVMTK